MIISTAIFFFVSNLYMLVFPPKLGEKASKSVYIIIQVFVTVSMLYGCLMFSGLVTPTTATKNIVGSVYVLNGISQLGLSIIGIISYISKPKDLKVGKIKYLTRLVFFSVLPFFSFSLGYFIYYI